MQNLSEPALPIHRAAAAGRKYGYQATVHEVVLLLVTSRAVGGAFSAGWLERVACPSEVPLGKTVLTVRSELNRFTRMSEVNFYTRNGLRCVRVS